MVIPNMRCVENNSGIRSEVMCSMTSSILISKCHIFLVVPKEETHKIKHVIYLKFSGNLTEKLFPYFCDLCRKKMKNCSSVYYGYLFL